jgi:predicted dehydrogenase
MSATDGRRVALVGLGYWGTKILRSLVALLGPDGVVAVDAEQGRRDEAARTHYGLSVLASMDEALSLDDVDAVLIATPVSSHVGLAQAALEAGRHVFVEKPLAIDPEQARRTAELADRSGLVLMVGHTYLFSPVIERMCAEVRSGGLGRVHYVTSERLNLGLYRDDANVIWDLAPHDLSVLMALLDEEPVAAQALARSMVRAGVPDVAFLNFMFPSGAVASVNVSWLAPRRTRQLVVVGDLRMMSYDDSRAEEPFKVYDRGVVAPEDDEVTDDRLTYRYGDTVSPVLSQREPLAVELAHFLSCVRDGATCRSDGWFGVRVVEALAAADQSWRMGGTPVAVERQGPDEVDEVIDLVRLEGLRATRERVG